MTKAYSVDLRVRVVASVCEDGLSRHAASRQFRVAPSTVITWVKLAEETGRFAPLSNGGHRPKTIMGAVHDWLVERCRERAFTIRGLVAELAARGTTVSYRPVQRFVHAQGLSYKKNPARRRAGPPRRRADAPAMAEISGHD
jgi:putative transposase